ncbi:hypothetical protein [Streptomyces agglomeratus]|uniref:hypothetical protein n=1 Tax=Streptomyces agglomeratus TaxID=285458 RepID=UPI000AB622B9|nr:hypothetical protein [Streptomyces agglomeratus]
MLVTPLPINVFLRHLLSASATSGYLGTVLLLARTADARAQHEELNQDWTSVHDLTGASLAVLSPVVLPDRDQPNMGQVGGVPHPQGGGRVAGAEGMRLHLPSSPDGYFERAFWQSVELEGSYSPFVQAAGTRPHSAEVHERGWTQATTSAAALFEIPESLLPCLLVLSMRERRGMVLDIEEHLSVYRLFKRLIVHIGPAHIQLAELLREQESAERRLAHLRIAEQQWRIELRRVPIEWPVQIDALWRHLGEVENLAPELIVDCRGRLAAIRDTGASDWGLAEKLREAIDALPPESELHRQNIRSGIRRRLIRVISKIENGHPGGTEGCPRGVRPDGLDEIPLLRERLAGLRDEIMSLRRLVESASLSDAVLSVGEELLAPLDRQRLASPRSLADWSFTHLKRRAGRTSPTAMRSA